MASKTTSLLKLESKIDLVVLTLETIRKGQEETRQELHEHTRSDQTNFGSLSQAQTQLSADIALLKKSQSDGLLGFTISWNSIRSVIAGLIIAGFSYWLASGHHVF
jgi:hypothetical protein